MLTSERLFLTARLWQMLAQKPARHWKLMIADRFGERRGAAVWAYSTIALMIVTLGAAVVACGTLWAAFLAYHTARVITRERMRGSLDLLALTPTGEAGIAWTVFAITLHYDIGYDNFKALWRLAQSVVILPGAVIVVLVSMLILFNADMLRLTTVLSLLVTALLLFFIIYLDTIYGVLTGGLIGLLCGYRRVEPLFAIFIIALLQVAGYLVMLLVGFGALPALAAALSFSTLGMTLTQSLIMLLVLVLLREATLRIAWHWVQTRLESPL